MNISIRCLGDFNLPKENLSRLIGLQKVGRQETAEFWLHDVRTNAKPFGRLCMVQCDNDDIFAVIVNTDHAPEHATLLQDSAYLKWDRKFHVYGQVVFGKAWAEDSSRSGRHGTQRLFVFGYNLETGYSRKGKGTCKGEASISFEGGVRSETFGYTQDRVLFIDSRVRHRYGTDFDVNGYFVTFKYPYSGWVRSTHDRGGYTAYIDSELTVKAPDGATKERFCGRSSNLFEFLGELSPETHLFATVASYPSSEIDVGVVQGILKLLAVPNPPKPPARTPLTRKSNRSGAHEVLDFQDEGRSDSVGQVVSMNSLSEAFDWSKIEIKT